MKKQKTNKQTVVRMTPGERSVQQPFDPQVAKGLHLAYIDERWEMLAAIAWKEYVAHGRGALLLQPDEQSDWDATYLALQSIETNGAMKEYTDMVKSYDPNSQVVTIFLTPPQHSSAYLGGLTPERPGPPEAYQQLKWLMADN